MRAQAAYDRRERSSRLRDHCRHDRIQRMIRFIARITLKPQVLLALALLALPMSVPVVMAQNLTVNGMAGGSKIYSLPELEALGLTEATEGREVSTGGRTQRLDVRYSGVLLARLLGDAGIEAIDRYKVRASTVIATAVDGYRASFSWGELFNSPAGASILVITRENGERLPSREGVFSLRSLSDQRPGPRHVRQVSEINVLLN